MKYFAILHKPTNFFLPFVGRGATHAEPVDPAVEPPRLFTAERAAKTALAWWLKGRTSVTRSYRGGFGEEYDDEHWETVPVEDRRADDMEVIALYMIR